MKHFYIETDSLTTFTGRTLRYVYSEDAKGNIQFKKVIDLVSNEEMSLEELKPKNSADQLVNIQTAYLGSYKRHYF